MSMRIIVSPAKKMNVDTDSLPWQDLPAFLPQTERLMEALRSMDAAQLQKLWKCSDDLAALNVERLQTMDEADRPMTIILSALSQDKVVQKALDLGAAYYMVKPFDMDALTQRIRQLMQEQKPLLKTQRTPTRRKTMPPSFRMRSASCGRKSTVRLA